MKPLIVSLGQRFRSDDGVGPFVLDELKNKLENFDFTENLGDIAKLLDSWEKRDLVYIVDCLFLEGEKEGKIHRFEGLKEKFLLNKSLPSSHSISLAEALELGIALNKLPKKLVVYGIVGKTFDPGLELNPLVKKAAFEVVGKIVKELSNA